MHYFSNNFGVKIQMCENNRIIFVRKIALFSRKEKSIFRSPYFWSLKGKKVEGRISWETSVCNFSCTVCIIAWVIVLTTYCRVPICVAWKIGHNCSSSAYFIILDLYTATQKEAKSEGESFENGKFASGDEEWGAE